MNPRTALSVWTMGALALMLAGCGGSSSKSPTGSTTPVSSVIAQGSFQIGTQVTASLGDPCDFVEFVEFQTNATGDIEAIVDWTFETAKWKPLAPTTSPPLSRMACPKGGRPPPMKRPWLCMCRRAVEVRSLMASRSCSSTFATRSKNRLCTR